MNSTLDDYGIKPENLRKKARIEKNGAVLLGENFSCDGHADRPVRVLTHVHYDHIGGLKKSLKGCENLVMTSESKELLKILYEDKFENFNNVLTLDYGETFQYGEEELVLHEARHILGAAQVQVKTKSGKNILFTGDFKQPGTPTPETDLLVLEATYGKPYQVRPFKDEIEKVFASFIEQRLEDGPVNIKGYHGKLQESLQILREKGIQNPAFMPSKIFETAKLYEKQRGGLGEFYPLEEESSSKGQDGGYPLRFFHMNSGRDFEVGTDVVKLSGWEFVEPVKRFGESFTIAMSDHSDFQQLLNHVKKCDPEFVITDDSRSDGAQTLAQEITKRTQKPATKMP